MEIIKLDATESTNQYAKDLLLSNTIISPTVIVAKKQLSGRGQMGTVWDSEEGKNLTFSVVWFFNDFKATQQIAINMAVSLAIINALKTYFLPHLKIKWPNDILSGNEKVCGILIENILQGNQIYASVIGIGLNINQNEFKGLPNASSLKQILGTSFNLDEVLQNVLENLEFQLKNIKEDKVILKQKYEDLLFRKDKPTTFENSKGEFFMGFIKGVSDQGKLIVALEDNAFKEFDLKEIKLRY